MFVTRCSPLTGHHIGNMTFLSAGRAEGVGGRLTLIGWFIVAAVSLSPILTFWVGANLSRFLRRKRQSRVLKRGAVVADRSGSTPRDNAVDKVVDPK
jgi:hypothetical protein